MASETDDFFASLDVPDFYLLVRAAADDLHCVGVERDAQHLCRVALESGQFLFRGKLPDLDQFVTACRHELCPVAAEIQIEDRVTMRAPRRSDFVFMGVD